MWYRASKTPMSWFDVTAVLITLAAVLSYVNTQYLKLPMTIGLMLIALCLSLALIVADHYGLSVRPWVEQLMHRIDFSVALLEGMLSFLLFAGSLHIDLGDLKKHRVVIGTLATFGVVVSTALVGTASYFCFAFFGLGMPFVVCLLFGALISPTDPIAVIAILKTAKAPRDLSTQIAGESLFNDGIAVVVFVALLRLLSGPGLGPLEVGVLLLREVGGGLVVGGAAGLVTYLLLKRVDDYQVEILLTLALVVGSYALSRRLHVSGPIAVVIAGLFIGNHGRSYAMSDNTRENIDKFWELVDEILNAVLFVLIGLEVFLVQFSKNLIFAGLSMIVVAVVARFVSVGIPLVLIRRKLPMDPGTVRILTWGGLRGGISVALALTLPTGPNRETIVAVTYHVVVFSILVQGLTIKALVKGVANRNSLPRPAKA